MSDVCRVCKREFPPGYREAQKRRKSDNVRLALAKAENVGRPRKASPDKVKALRAKGFSWTQIAGKLGVSKGACQYAAKERVK